MNPKKSKEPRVEQKGAESQRKKSLGVSAGLGAVLGRLVGNGV